MKQTHKHIDFFWKQLEQTIDQLLDSRDEDRFDADSLLKDYREQLEKIDRNLTFHFERDDEQEGLVEMIFGCDGFPESISAVLSLIGAAPDLQGISFKAFNHRYDPVPSHINIGDELCDIKDFWFSLRDVRGRLNLDIYMTDVPGVLDMDPRVEAVMIFLDALIGEYELMTRIQAMDWFELPAAPDDYGLLPLSELRPLFDIMKLKATPVGIKLH
ncbi:MAG: hypothetical protein ACPGF7_15395 [Pontibacterium sp.]